MVHRVWDLTRKDDMDEFQALNATGMLVINLIADRTGAEHLVDITPDCTKLEGRRDRAERCLVAKQSDVTRSAEEAYREVMVPYFEGARFLDGWEEIEKRLGANTSLAPLQPKSQEPSQQALNKPSATVADPPKSALRETGKDFLMFLFSLVLIAVVFGLMILVAHFEAYLTGWLAWPLIIVGGLVTFFLLLPMAIMTGRAFVWGIFRRIFS